MQIGQQASISLDALPETELAGEVTSIASKANLVTGVISYQMRIDIDPTDAPLRVGISATASIITAIAEDALVVQNRLIEIDRENDRAYVEVVQDTEFPCVSISDRGCATSSRVRSWRD